MRFVGIKNNNIHIVSDKHITNSDLKIIELPNELENLSSEELITNYHWKNNQLICKLSKIPREKLKVAFVGNWKMQCGISTYSENLWPFLIKNIYDYRLFIEHNPEPTGSIYETSISTLDPNKIISCWTRGESLVNLVCEINKFEPDIVFIQHEFGLWSNARYWLAFLTQVSKFRIIVTMHSVFYHKDKTIVEAAIPEIVVHLDGAKNLLKNIKQVPGKVYVIPHGCDPCVDKTKLWNFYKSDRTFIQFGFGHRYKNFEDGIKATAILKKKYQDVFFTAVFSDSSQNKQGYQFYFDELLELVNSLDLKDNVAIIKGFQSDETLNSYIRTNKAAIFPYKSNKDHEVFGSTGAARYCMTKNIPVISSSVHHFSDVPSIKADGPEEIADKLDLLFSSDSEIIKQLNIQEKFLADTSWINVAESYLKLFENP